MIKAENQMRLSTIRVETDLKNPQPVNLYIVLLTAQLLQEKTHLVSNPLLYKEFMFSASRLVDRIQGSRSIYTETGGESVSLQTNGVRFLQTQRSHREGTKPDTEGWKPCHCTSTLKAAMVNASRA